MEKRDWAAIKNEYMTGRESLQKLADKHNIPLRTIKDRSKKEGWVEERKKFRTETAQKASQKTMKKEAQRLAKLRDVAEDAADLIQEDIEQLKKLHKKRRYITESDVKMIKDLTVALKNLADIMRDVYSIPTIREKLLLDKYRDYKKSLEEMEKDGGVIILSEILEQEEKEDEAKDRMEPTAEAEGISAKT